MRWSRRLRILRPYLRPHAGRFAIAAIAFVIKDSPLWVLPIITAEVINLLIAGASPASLTGWGAAGAAIIAVNVLANAVYVRAYFSAVRGIGATLRANLARQLQNLSISYHARSASAIAQTKLIRDVEGVELMLQQSFGPILNSISILIGACITIAFRVPAFLVVFALTVPIAVALMRWLRSRTSAANERFRREVERMSTQIGEMGSLMNVTRAHGLEAVAVQQVTTSAEQVRAAGFDLDRINGRFGAISWASFQTLSLVCLFGATLMSLSGTITISAGNVVLLSSYFGLLTGTLVNAFQLAPLITRGMESLTSIDEVLADDDVEDNDGKPEITTVQGKLTFNNVTFGYGDKPVIRDIQLTVRPGDTVALIGPSGSGKSTLLNLALGLIHPGSGRVLIDEHDLRDIDRRSYRRHVSVVPQEPVLSAGSIRQNIAYGIPQVTDEAVWDALQQAHADEFVRQLPAGWDTIVGERGGQLSGGQRQRIAIARALIRNPRVLLLDEATSALDSTSEQAVQTALETLRRGRTTLVVAHRLSTIRSADLIVVLDSGRAVQAGTHQTLAEQDGYYRYMLQRSTAD